MDETSFKPPRLKVAFVGWIGEPNERITVACDAYDDDDRNWEVAVNASDRTTAIRALKAAGLHGLSKKRISQFEPGEELSTLARATPDEVVYMPGRVY